VAAFGSPLIGLAALSRPGAQGLAEGGEVANIAPDMRRVWLCLSVVFVLGACAGARVHKALAEKTDKFVFDKPIADVWPVAKLVLEERNFIGTQSGGQYHLETPTLTPDGQLPSAGTGSSSSTSSPNGAAGQGQGGGRMGGAGGRRGGGSPTADRAGGEVIRYVVDGDAVDDTHCTVRIVRFSRQNVDSPESEGILDAELEWKLISRAAPERAAEIRKELAAQGIQAP
jgi:hypothetical protein